MNNGLQASLRGESVPPTPQVAAAVKVPAEHLLGLQLRATLLV